MKSQAQTKSVDVLIIGAGAAGLAAAAELSQAGKSFLIIEARERIGGRIFTHRDPVEGFPMELGAEFIHGEPESTLALLRQGGLAYYDALDSHFHRKDGKFQEMDEYWDELGAVLEKLEADRTEDRSFSEFLKAHEQEFKPEVLEIAKSFIQGFQASDAELISEKDLALAQNDPDAIDESKMFKIFDGYDQMIQTMASLIPDLVSRHLRLGRALSKVTWSKHRVRAETTHTATGFTEAFTARKIIVTLPVGVLQRPSSDPTGVEFAPRPEGLTKACEALKMGSALRLSLRFRSPIWARTGEPSVGFLHAEDSATFRIWWTPLPAHHPYLTAWIGGVRAEQLSGKDVAALTKIAIEDLARVLDVSVEELSQELVSIAYHDWTSDPYSRGAYSYVVKGGVEAATEFHRPIEDTLIFAGEGTLMGSERGTVSGAIRSGRRAAELALKTASES